VPFSATLPGSSAVESRRAGIIHGEVHSISNSPSDLDSPFGAQVSAPMAEANC
jgi:hypothetical protein